MIPMTSSTSIEPFITFSRRSLLVLLIAFLWLAATCVAVAFFPESIVARWPIRAPWLFPVAMIGGWAALRATLRGHRWDPQIAKVMKDEFRQSNMLRAQRAAFFTVMLLQA